MSYDELAVVAEVRRITLTELRLCVSEGWIRPSQSEAGPVFDDLDIARLRLVCDLRSEMSLPDDAVPVVLSLIDQLHGMRRELKSLARAIDGQPENIRQAIIDTHRQDIRQRP
ncbi:MAG: chaperone modulator CbpM [Pseudomonadota bacterium]